MVDVEVIYCAPGSETTVHLQLERGTTVTQLRVLLTGQAEFADTRLDFATIPMGVWGQLVTDEHELAAGDRIEIYRPLQADAKTARRRRAEKQAMKKSADKG